MEILDKYEINFETSKIPIVIYSSKDSYIGVYEVGILEVGDYTKFIVEKIKEDLLREGIFEKDKDDNFTYDELKKAYVKKVKELIQFYLPVLNYDDKDKLVTYIVQKSLDLGFVDIIISDPNIEELTINGGSKKIMIYHRKHGWLETNLNFIDDDEINNIASRIALENKKFFSNLTPLLDAHLRGGHRVNATLNPISTMGTTLTIRRFSDKPWTVSDLINSKTSSSIALAMIWIAMENEFSIIVAGGTGSGKTSFLNAISTFIPASQRIISVEDTREIRLPDYSHWVPMEARQSNQEGRGEVSMLDLIMNSLRMRPDRIIIGEIRKKKEAEVLFEAMRTGHSVYGTFHANNAHETVLRLSSSPIEIPKFTLSALGLIVIQSRDRRSGQRVTLQIAELDEDGNERVLLQFNPKTKKYFMKNKPKYLTQKLDEFQGIDEKEFFDELKRRALVLEYLAKYNITEIDDVGKVINRYYKDKDNLIKEAFKKLKEVSKKPKPKIQ
ncbi:MAG: ATPase, T2SS/T4P/T4SS family [Candidatus Woesearchaeota archaeon]|jgi:flagellar protein FlaI|nr:ATPase, T2SS/T4P/T4SS family [Candidatus Woesearchaeota archaeon]